MRYAEVVAGLVVTLGVTWALAGGAHAASGTRTNGPVREFTIVAQRFAFTPNRIEVDQGDHVKLTLRSADGTHGLAIKKLKIDVSIPKGGAPVVVEFDVPQPGEFPFACSEYLRAGSLADERDAHRQASRGHLGRT